MVFIKDIGVLFRIVFLHRHGAIPYVLYLVNFNNKRR